MWSLQAQETLDIITKKGTLSLALMGTGVASTITCSIEGDVLNMGYVIARESVSLGFKVKHVAGPGATHRLGEVPMRGPPRLSHRAGRVAAAPTHPLPHHPQQLSLHWPLQPVGRGLRMPLPLPLRCCPGLLTAPIFLPQGLCMGWGPSPTRGHVGSYPHAGRRAWLFLLPRI